MWQLLALFNLQDGREVLSAVSPSSYERENLLHEGLVDQSIHNSHAVGLIQPTITVSKNQPCLSLHI